MQINHKISIQNLGPIELIENLEVKNINILIGESGTGKSVIAKTIFVFNDFFHHPIFSIDMEKSLKEKLEKTLERFFYDYENYKIKYEYSEIYFIEVTKKSKKLNINFSPKLKAKIHKIENEVEKSSIFQTLYSKENETTKFDKKKIEQLIDNIRKNPQNKIYGINQLSDELGIKETIFIPASRSFLLDLNEVIINSVLSGAEAVGSEGFEYMMLRFTKEYLKYKKLFSEINKEFNQILKGAIVNESDQFKFRPSGKRGSKSHISLSSLSSGQKEIFPIAVILSHLIKEKKQILLIIEEPEAHLFPKDQLKIFEILVYFSNVSKSELIITTHSPYIRNAANNMLLGQKIEITNKTKKTIDPKKCQVNFLENGQAKSILNDDEIDTDYIDSASEITLKEYQKLITKSK